VFLLGGQSNAVGHGVIGDVDAQYSKYLYDNDSINTYNKFTDEIVNLTTNTSILTSDAFDFGSDISFMYEAKEHYNDTVYMVKWCRGGIPLYFTGTDQDWNVKTSNGYYDTLMLNAARTKEIIQTKHPLANIVFEAVLWVQGEADAMNDIDSAMHRNNLDSLKQGVRNTLQDSNIEFIIVRTQPITTATTIQMDRIRAAEVASAEADPRAYWVNADTLTLEPDMVHFNSNSLINLGRMGWEAFINKENNLAE
jgi:hypothetical protein